MTMVLNKKQMTEEDIKTQYITPAITSKWDLQKITMETQITDGKINLKGNFAVREKPKRVDYLLYLSPNNPIAVVEAKDNTHSVSAGLQQAIDYAKMLDLPFAYSSNGDGFMEHDFTTGTERELAMDEFPSEEELVARYKNGCNGGKGLTPEEQKILEQPYFSSMDTYPPRYDQRIAVNRTLDAIARGQNRILLVMATGTGKTYTAFQIVYRLLKSGIKHKILYLADRNLLVDQSIRQDFAPLVVAAGAALPFEWAVGGDVAVAEDARDFLQLPGGEGGGGFGRLGHADRFLAEGVEVLAREAAAQELGDEPL